MRGRKAVLRVPAFAGLATVLALLASGCGDSGEPGGTISADAAASLQADLATIQAQVNEGNCDGAKAAVQAYITDVNHLPAEATESLKAVLRGGGDHLNLLIDDDVRCSAPPIEPTPDTGASGEGGAQPQDSSSGTDTTGENQPSDQQGDKPGKGPKGSGTNNGSGGTGG